MFRSLNAACKYYTAHLAICAHLHNAFSLTVGGSEEPVCYNSCSKWWSFVLSHHSHVR